MNYLSVCSGIEAATVAWQPLGWRALWYSEIERFPNAALAQHYPTTPNLGDMTGFQEWPDARPDVLVGGTPCQSFSIAGLRKGLDDPRGNLMLTYLAVAARYRPHWLVWENVPGVLSSNGGRDFGTLLGALGKLGYGFAYRVLDAQYYGVPQRRRRVFVVGHLGSWRRAAAVLFERESLQGNPPPRREAGERTSPTIGDCSNGGGANGLGRSVDSDESLQVVAPTIPSRSTAGGGLGTDFDLDGGLVAGCVTARDGKGPDIDCTQTLITHALRGEGHDASEDGAGRGVPLVPVVHAIQERAVCDNQDAGPDGVGIRSDGIAYTLEARQRPQAIAFNAREDPVCTGAQTGALGAQHPQSQAVAFAENSRAELRLCGGDGQTSSQLTAGGGKPGQGMACVAFDLRGREGGSIPEGPRSTVSIRSSSGGSSRSYLAMPSTVRRITPREAERLQGFPDDYTLIPSYANGSCRGDREEIARWIMRGDSNWTWEAALAAAGHPDGPRYKALGNSMAVPVMRWLGERIAAVDAICQAVSEPRYTQEF